MTKGDLINEIAAKADMNKVAAKAALDACLESIAQALANDDKVQAHRLRHILSGGKTGTHRYQSQD